jgi:hypothetical protein
VTRVCMMMEVKSRRLVKPVARWPEMADGRYTWTRRPRCKNGKSQYQVRQLYAPPSHLVCIRKRLWKD